jgi:hypothetical protein
MRIATRSRPLCTKRPVLRNGDPTRCRLLHARDAQVAWSGSRPSVFWALDADDTLHAIDLTDTTGKPFVSSPMHTDGSGRRAGAAAHANGYANGTNGLSNGTDGAHAAERRPMRFALDAPADGKATGSGRGAEGAQRLAAVTCQYAGVIEVHVLTAQCADGAGAHSDEVAKLHHCLRRL